MVPRTLPSRPYRLGTRRRRGKAATPQAAGASGRNAAPSLDTEKLLATSYRNILAEQVTQHDLRDQQWALHTELVRTVGKIRQRWKNAPADNAEALWWDAYENERKPLKDETVAELWVRVDKWLRENKATGKNAKVLKWEKLYRQLNRCQREWIGYRAACCTEKTTAIAVPIGCNHRLCPVCAWHRAQAARVRIKKMFDRLSHPIFITLTIPNIPARDVAQDGRVIHKGISKHTFTLFRQRVRAFLAGYDGYIRGGVYSIETTYNRRAKTWHIHAHILADAIAPLPSKNQKVWLGGWFTFAFNAIKYRMEFDWLRLWRGDLGKSPRKNAASNVVDGERYEFEQWVAKARGNTIKGIDGLTVDQIARRTAWNEKFRRVIDVRGVDNREKAAMEVLKYITKGADFSDNEFAVEEFCDAVKGARLVQTFGTWYGVNFDADFDTDHLDDWGELKCTCGLNVWERMGIFYREDVVMDAAGRWHLRRPLDHNCRGTVARPTIRALDREPEVTEETYDSWTKRHLAL